MNGHVMKITDFSALTFDVYGTLIDWESGMIRGLEPLTSRLERTLGRNEILEAHARHESYQQAQTPWRRYPELLASVYRRLAEEWGVRASWSECQAYGRSVGDWPAFADSAESLQYLKRHFKLVVLSNVDNESFEHGNRKLAVEFDAVYTAEDIGSYKPSDRNFDYLLARIGDIGISREEILHTAESVFHDHEPAARHGLTACHIYRRHDQAGFGATMKPATRPEVAFRFHSMADLAGAVREEIGD